MKCKHGTPYTETILECLDCRQEYEEIDDLKLPYDPIKERFDSIARTLVTITDLIQQTAVVVQTLSIRMDKAGLPK